MLRQRDVDQLKPQDRYLYDLFGSDELSLQALVGKSKAAGKPLNFSDTERRVRALGERKMLRVQSATRGGKTIEVWSAVKPKSSTVRLVQEEKTEPPSFESVFEELEETCALLTEHLELITTIESDLLKTQARLRLTMNRFSEVVLANEVDQEVLDETREAIARFQAKFGGQ